MYERIIKGFLYLTRKSIKSRCFINRYYVKVGYSSNDITKYTTYLNDNKSYEHNTPVLVTSLSIQVALNYYVITVM